MISLQYACDFLEIPPGTLNLHKGMSYSEAVKGLKEFKEFLKKHKRTLARKYHPDKNIQNEEKMKQINNMIDELMCFELPPPVQRPIFSMVFHHSMPSEGTSSTTVFGSPDFFMRTTR